MVCRCGICSCVGQLDDISMLQVVEHILIVATHSELLPREIVQTWL